MSKSYNRNIVPKKITKAKVILENVDFCSIHVKDYHWQKSFDKAHFLNFGNLWEYLDPFIVEYAIISSRLAYTNLILVLYSPLKYLMVFVGFHIGLIISLLAFFTLYKISWHSTAFGVKHPGIRSF